MVLEAWAFNRHDVSWPGFWSPMNPSAGGSLAARDIDIVMFPIIIPRDASHPVESPDDHEKRMNSLYICGEYVTQRFK